MTKAPATKTATKAVATTTVGSVPDYLKGVDRSSGLQGLDMSDYVVPRVKLLQAISPEVTTFDEAKAGMFWLNVLDVPLGKELKFTVISNKKRYLLTVPLGGSPDGILARADDGVHWSPPDGAFDIKLKGQKKTITWKTAKTVRESGLGEFGTQDPENSESPPAATLFYEYLADLPDYPEYSPCLLSFARSQAKRARDLNGKIEFRKAPMQAQRFVMKITDEKSAEGPYSNVSFVSDGWAPQTDYERCVAMAARYKDYRGADEEGAVAEEQGRGGGGAATSDEY